MDDGMNAVNTGSDIQAPSASVESGEDFSQSGENLSNTEESIQNDASSENLDGELNQEAQEVSKAVPYERFKEVTEKLRQAEQDAIAFRALKEDPNMLKAYYESQMSRMPKPEESNPEVESAIETLKQRGFISRDEAQSMVREAIRAEKVEEQIFSRFRELEGKYSGKDGTPKFDSREIAEFMDSEGHVDPEKAYLDKYMNQILDARLKEGRKATPYTEGRTQPMSSGGTGNFKAEFEEAKRTGDWTDIIKKNIPLPRNGSWS